MDNWDDLRFVVALARYGSMANAARFLRTNTATVSRRIKRLNESADTVLFLKGAHEWELTAEGRRLYEMAASFGDELETFKAATHETAHSIQTVRVSGLDFLNSEVLSTSLHDFHAAYPNITLELAATERNVSLAYGEADIALRLTRPNEGRLVARRIADVKMGVYGAKDQPQERWVGLPYDLDWTPEMKNGITFLGREPSLRVSSFSAIINAMKATGLSGIAPDLMMRGRDDFKLMQPTSDQRNREVWMLLHETRRSDVGIRNTCKWIERSFLRLGS